MRNLYLAVMVLVLLVPAGAAADWQIEDVYSVPSNVTKNGTSMVGFQLRNEEGLDDPVYPSNCSSLTTEASIGGETTTLSYLDETRGYYAGDVAPGSGENVSFYAAGSGCPSFLDGDASRSLWYGDIGNLSVSVRNTSDEGFVEGENYRIWSDVFYNGTFVDVRSAEWSVFAYDGERIDSGEMRLDERGPYRESDNVFIGNVTIPDRDDGVYILSVEALADNVSFSNPYGGEAIMITTEKRLDGILTMERSGEGCNEEVSVCEDGAEIAGVFRSTSSNATVASINVTGGGVVLVNDTMQKEGWEWRYELAIPDPFDYDTFGEQLNVEVNASNNNTGKVLETTVYMDPFSIDADTSSRTVPQGDKVTFQTYPERPFTGSAISLNDVESLSVEVSGEDRSLLSTTLDGDRLDRFASPTNNGFFYPFRVPWNAVPGNYTVKITATYTFGQEETDGAWFEVVEGSGSAECSLVDNFICVYTEGIDTTISAGDEAEILLDIESVAPTERTVDYDVKGGLLEVVDPGSITVRPNARSDVSIPVERIDGSFEGNIEVAGGVFVPVELTVDLPAPNMTAEASVENQEYAPGDEATVDLLIENTGTVPVSDLLVEVPAVGYTSFVQEGSSNVTINAGSSYASTFEISTEGLSSGSYTGDDALGVRLASDKGEVSTNVSLTVFEPIQQSVDSLNQEVDGLEEDADAAAISEVRGIIDEAEQLWASGSYSAAREKLSTAEDRVTSIEQEIQREQVDESQEETQDTGQSSGEGGVPWMTMLTVVLLLGVVGGVVWLSIVPE